MITERMVVFFYSQPAQLVAMNARTLVEQWSVRIRSASMTMRKSIKRNALVRNIEL